MASSGSERATIHDRHLAGDRTTTDIFMVDDDPIQLEPKPVTVANRGTSDSSRDARSS
jgi:hypothetical protein